MKEVPPSPDPNPAEKENSPSIPSKLSTSRTAGEKEAKPKSNAEKTRSKPKSTQMKWPKKSSKFANLPTTVLNSPIKAADSDIDEIDFLA